MTKLLQQLVDNVLLDVEADVHRAACLPGGEIAETLRYALEMVERQYMGRKVNARTKAETFARYEAEVREAQDLVEKSVREAFARYRKAHAIALLEYPALQIRTAEALRKRKIRYLFETQMDRNILTVHIVNEYFFEIPLTLENADRTLGLVSYFIHRPEYAHEELPEIRKVWSRQLSRQWEKLTADTVSTV
jgi:hypothetical protein